MTGFGAQLDVTDFDGPPCARPFCCFSAQTRGCVSALYQRSSPALILLAHCWRQLACYKHELLHRHGQIFSSRLNAGCCACIICYALDSVLFDCAGGFRCCAASADGSKRTSKPVPVRFRCCCACITYNAAVVSPTIAGGLRCFAASADGSYCSRLPVACRQTQCYLRQVRLAEWMGVDCTMLGTLYMCPNSVQMAM